MSPVDLFLRVARILEIRIWVTRMGTVSGWSWQIGVVSGWSRQPLVCYHTQIYGPVHGATTHENSTTMSLYGYNRAQYVVGPSLGVPTSGVDCVGAQSLDGDVWVWL
jgi:hypothetical protein